MRRPSLALLALFLLAPAALAQREYGFDNRKPSGQPYLTPEESLKRFKIAPEFEIDLFAAEPLIVNPVAFAIDERGRIWAIECFEYPKRAAPAKFPRDRIVILEDTDGDGVCDKRTVFAEGKDFPIPPERLRQGLGAFDLATGIEVGNGGVYVGAPPYLWFIENKDDKPGKFEVLLKGFGSQDTHETLNTFQWGPDGWLYGLHGVFTNSAVESGQLDGPATRLNGAVWRYQPRQRKFEIFAEGTSNPWGMDWRNTDGQFILCCCVIPHLFHVQPGGIYKRQAGSSFNPYAFGYLNEICDHTFHKESGWAHAGLISLDAPHIPEKYRDSVIFGSIHGCSVKRNVLRRNGSTFIASREDDFLQSGDKNFRPINMKWGPNGDIYLIDWHDQNPCHQAAADSWDYDHGRVFRIQLKGTKTAKAPDLGTRSFEQLANAVVESKNPWEYRTALRLIYERSDEHLARSREPFPDGVRGRAIVERALESDDRAVQARAMWLQEACRLQPDEFDHTNPIVRAWAVRFRHGQRYPRQGTYAELAAKETDPRVRAEWAAVAGRFAEKDPEQALPIVRALMGHREDAKDPVIPQLVWLAYEKVLARDLASGGRKSPESPLDRELSWLAGQAPGNEFARDQIVPRVMRRLVATGRPEDLESCVRFVAGVKDPAARERALDGLAIALNNQTVNVPEGWAALQDEIRRDGNPRLVPLANRLAVSFKDPKAIARAVDAATNTGLPGAERVEAVRQLGQLKAPETVPLLLKLLRTDRDTAVRAEAARSLAAFDDPKLGAEILAGWKDYPKTIQPDVVNTLATRKEWARALLQAMADGKVDRSAVTDNTILRIQAFKDPELNKRIEKAWGRTRPTPAELTATIDKTRVSLDDGPGSFARGRVVFENTCAKCHKFEGKGSDVGPPLDGAARDVEYLLVNVIDPNRVIGAPYFIRVARLQDGTVQQGVLAEEDEKSITLKQENGVLKRILKADLDGPVQVVEKSLMPEGLSYNMSPQDFRDLVRYLMANPFLTEVTVNGERRSVGVPGRILLPEQSGPVVVEAEVTATADLKTVLLVGSSADYEVRLDGKPIGTGKGTGKQVQPDQTAFEVVVPKGKHTVTVAVKGGGAGNVLFARFADPDRKLRYPDPGEKR
jgi:putative membrane-bound dehydrogenase-like protein